MENCNGVATPIDPNIQLSTAPPDYTASKSDQLEYQQAIGSIMFAMLGTRPELGFPISTLSKYCINPTPEHSVAVQRVLRYLDKTVDVGITFNGQHNPVIDEALGNSDLTGLFGFTDSD